MAKRDDVVPEKFLHHLQTEIPGFSDETLKDQCKLPSQKSSRSIPAYS